jgi:hypothetical protein
MTLFVLSVAVLATLALIALLQRPRAVQLPAVAMAAYRRSLARYDLQGLLAFHRRQFGGAVMAIVFDGPVTPDDVTTFVRAVPQSDEFILDQLLPNRYFDDNTVDFAELTRTNRTARFRAWDGRLHVSERDTGSTKAVKLPPLSSSLSTGEYETLQLQFARTGGSNTSALVQAIYNDSEQLTREVLNRMELARGDALSDFRFQMLGGNTSEPPALAADYGAPAGHMPAPAVLWTVANLGTMTPLTDLIAWRDVMLASGGGRPDTLVLSNVRASIVQRSAEIINAVHGSNAGRTRVSRAELNDLLASEDLPAPRTYDASVDVDGTTTRILGDDKVLLANAPTLGYTAWGVTATALELVGSNQSELDFEEARGIVGVVEKAGPPYREFVFVDACGMPVIANPRALVAADVA